MAPELSGVVGVIELKAGAAPQWLFRDAARALSERRLSRRMRIAGSASRATTGAVIPRTVFVEANLDRLYDELEGELSRLNHRIAQALATAEA